MGSGAPCAGRTSRSEAGRARAPLATDGCVALSNDDLLRLTRLITPRDTPVVIAQQIEWVAPDRSRSDSATFLEVLQQWQQARLRDDEAALAAFYSEASGGERVWLHAPRAAEAQAASRTAPRGKAGASHPAPLAGFAPDAPEALRTLRSGASTASFSAPPPVAAGTG